MGDPVAPSSGFHMCCFFLYVIDLVILPHDDGHRYGSAGHRRLCCRISLIGKCYRRNQSISSPQDFLKSCRAVHTSLAVTLYHLLTHKRNLKQTANKLLVIPRIVVTLCHIINYIKYLFIIMNSVVIKTIHLFVSMMALRWNTAPHSRSLTLTTDWEQLTNNITQINEQDVF